MIGYIYKLISSQTEKCYIGSTFNPQQRLRQHKSDYRRWLDGTSPYISSFEIIKFGDVAIEILEEVDVESKKELYQIEGIYQRECDETVNKNIAGRKHKERYRKTLELRPDYNKKNYQRKLEINPNHNKEDYQKALERNPNHNKQRYKRALQRNPNYSKENYQKYREKILQRNAEKVICDCGCVLSRNHLLTHQKSQTHISKVLELQSEELEERCQIRFFYNNRKEVKKFYIYASIEDVKRSIEGETRNPAELFSIL